MATARLTRLAGPVRTRVARFACYAGGTLLLACPASGLIFFPKKTVEKMVMLVVLKRIRDNNPAMAGLDAKAASAQAATPAAAQKTSKTSDHSHPGALDWLDQNVFGKITFSGSRQFGYHLYQVSGDQSAYDSLNQYGQGGSAFTDAGNINLAGDKVLGLLTFQMSLQDQHLQDPTNQQVRVDLDRGPVSLSEGDIQGSLLSDNPLTTFSKSLKGTEFGFKTKRAQLKALYSETKGVARTVSIPGANSVGPYYLESGKIEDNNLEVEVDGVAMRQGSPGVGDYTADTQTGSITFNSRVIAQTSTIVVTYESITPNATPGILQGVAGSYDLGKYGRFGLSGIQLRGTGVAGDGTITDPFQFYQNGIYTLSYEPIVSTIFVQLDTRELFPGTWQNGAVIGGDYAINPAEPRQIVLSPTVVSTNDSASGSTLYVRYRPLSVQTVDGDRQVWGFDYRLGLGRNVAVQYDQATGSTLNTQNGSSGVARDLSATYKGGALTLSGTVKDIPSDFVGIESQSFSRNEQSYGLTADYKKTRFDYGLSYSNAMVGQETTVTGATTGVTSTGSSSTDASTGTATTELLNARSTVAKAFVKYNSPDGTAWSVTETRTGSHLIYDSQLDTTSLAGSRTIGRLKLGSGVDLQNGEGPLTSQTGTTVVGPVSLETYHVDAAYEVGNHLNLTSRVSLSDISALGAKTQGNDINLGATWKPSTRWSLSARTTQSNSGQAATLSGFSNGTGYGYGGGNGFSSGALGAGYLGAANSIYDSTELRVGFQATSRIELSTAVSLDKTVGALASNTSNQTVSFDADWDLGKINILHASLNRTDTSYLESSLTGESTSTDVRVSLNGAPKGRWSYLLGFGTLLPGGSGLYQQTSLNYDFNLTYALARRQRVGFTYSDGIYTGLYGQDLHEVKATYGYQIFHGVELTAGYGIHQVTNTGPLATTGAYRANGFDFNVNLGL